MNDFEIKSDFESFKKVFLDENSRLNLISKNDEKVLFEKHFYDSLAIKKFFEKYDYLPQTILDIGTGGGFPAVPISLEYPNISVTGIDSISKKIKAVESMKERLHLANLTLINDRVENIKDKRFDLIVSRAVSNISQIIEYAYPLLNERGYIVLYKSKTANTELDEAKNNIRKHHLKILPLLEYKLPVRENYTRLLVILEKRGNNG